MSTKAKLIILIAVLVAVGGYFAVRNSQKGVPTLDAGIGILQSSVEIRNAYPGWEGSVTLTIINGKDQDRTFSISLEQPGFNELKPGYVAFPEEYYDWFTITEPTINIAAGKYYETLIIFAMPEDAHYDGKQTEVRVRVSDLTPQGIVGLAVESRWYIITAEKEQSSSI